MQVIRKIISREDLNKIFIPEAFGDRLEVLIFPFSSLDEKSYKDENFFASNANLLIQEDVVEDAIWKKYL